MKKVAFHTLGCKLNFAETSAIARQLKDCGYSKVMFDDVADVYVINTCSVTENADKECRSIVRKALSKNPEAFITVIGCYAQLKPQEIAQIEGVDLVLGANEKFNLPEFLNLLQKNETAAVHSCDISSLDFFVNSYSSDERTRVFLKVQDGCDYTCSYCTIPLARGKSRSDTIHNVVSNAKKIAADGAKEIVLTGVNIGDFGIDPATQKRNESFIDLLRELDEVNGIERFRISSIEPNLLTNEIIQFVADSKKFVPHFHIPLQSGSDKILGLMRRRYKSDLYRDKIALIKNAMPHCAIGVDVIVGFPGETDEDFLQTYHFLNNIDITYLHVFTYSERDNTLADTLPQVVPVNVRRKRNKMLRTLSEKKQAAFNRNFEGSKRPVLFENENKNGEMTGYTDNYIRVNATYDESMANQVVQYSL